MLLPSHVLWAEPTRAGAQLPPRCSCPEFFYLFSISKTLSSSLTAARHRQARTGTKTPVVLTQAHHRTPEPPKRLIELRRRTAGNQVIYSKTWACLHRHAASDRVMEGSTHPRTGQRDLFSVKLLDLMLLNSLFWYVVGKPRHRAHKGSQREESGELQFQGSLWRATLSRKHGSDLEHDDKFFCDRLLLKILLCGAKCIAVLNGVA